MHKRRTLYQVVHSQNILIIEHTEVPNVINEEKLPKILTVDVI